MRHFKAIHLYVAGTVLMVLATITGKIIQEDLARLGAQGFLESGNPINTMAMFFFIFAFPLGIGISLSGAMLLGGRAKTKPLLFTGLAVVSIAIIMFIHKVLGVSHSPNYFGAGGVSIMLLIAISIWYWGKYRAQLSPVSRKAVDLQAVGYLFFALAAWNLCGVGGPPGFALYPEKMLVLEPKFFAVAQLKVVMAFFVIAWIFTALGFKKAANSAQKANSQIG
jgi:hypothetical protein